jgi:uncharacterized repeat protein (TIGR02543 family)
MKNDSQVPGFGSVRRALLFLMAALTVLACLGCSQPSDPSPPPSYKVVFYLNDETDKAVETMIVQSPATTLDSLPADPTRLGYVFTGWNIAPSGKGAAFTLETTVKADMTVYARWGSYSYTVTFDSNGGSRVSPSTMVVRTPAYTVETLPKPPSRNGYYTFGSWNTAADGSGGTFDENTPVTDNITVYAQWQSYSYTVTFDSNGGDTAARPATKTVIRPAYTVETLPVPPTKTGYIFDGWNTAADGTGSNFNEYTSVADSITVYARWRSYSYTVTFDNIDGNTPAKPSTMTVSSPATTVGTLPEPPAKTGYAFGGWYTTRTIPPAFAPPSERQTFDETTPVTYDITVYALWQSYSYTVTFDNNGGDTPADPATKTVSTPAATVETLPRQPTRDRYEFEGWNTAADGSGETFDANTTVTESIIVYAQWEAYVTGAFIVLRLDDPGSTAFNSGGSFSIRQGGEDRTISLSGSWDISPPPDWRVDGKSRSTGDTITLSGDDYAVGGHSLQLTAYKDGAPWSKTMTFTVTGD